jgi:hypothetical protein
MSDFFAGRTAQGRELDRREAEHNNSSRWATAHFKVVSQGVGRARHEAVLRFPVAFVEEPLMTQGSGVIHNPDSAGHWEPEGSAGVWSWARDASGLYVGCKIWTSVVYEPRGDGASDSAWQHVSVQHWLLFQGVALKSLGQEARDASASLQPRTVRF